MKTLNPVRWRPVAKTLVLVAAACAGLFTNGCTLSVEAPSQTTVAAENDLTNVSVSVSGASITLDSIVLYGVTIGDQYFSSVPAGYLSADKSTSRTGTVSVGADSGVGYVGGHGVYLFTDFNSSTAFLNSGVSNTVTFTSSFLSGAAISVRTRVKVENDLINLTVDVSGVSVPVSAIDLAGVTVGDVVFDFVAGGTTSASHTTNSSGNVAVTADSVYVHYTSPFGIDVVQGFACNASLAVTITPGISNTVVFDETTAGSLLSSLAKKRVGNN